MTRTTKLRLQRVHYMPKELEPGILYVSEEFDVAGHLCACGCGNKVMTPLGPTEWAFHQAERGPSLRPSIGNWQLPCRSHYWIDAGRVEWSGGWSPDQVDRGRRAEGERRRAYYESRKTKDGVAARVKRWLEYVLSWFR
jgi:hypothetical protein